jgi:GNAT superfamily N-acetyltransferase
MQAIVVDYYEKTEAGKGVPTFDVDWEYYLNMEVTNKLVLITARDEANDELIGFDMYLIAPHPHHKTVMFAFCDTLAVKLGHRHKGVGKKLVQAAESYLKLFYVKRVVHGFRAVYDAKPLFPSIGYTLLDSNYVKVL